MAESKHTPGEWWIEDRFVFANGVRIADCYPNEEDEIKRSDDQIDADARLIAAGPELLAACKNVNTMLKSMEKERAIHFAATQLGYQNSWCQSANMLDDAIAKAEGNP